MTLHIEVPVQVGTDIPGRKTSEMPLDNITVLGKMRHRLGEIAFYLIFTNFHSVSFYCLVSLTNMATNKPRKA